jgi:Response regulators consisting of a CheY-like receiver domain and a winged-helix DNA-binding domain
MKEALQILAVEDEKAVAQILAVVLGGPMAKVSRAADGWEALIKIAASPKPFDVVITDHRMPRMSGLELVKRLRARKFTGKILVLSAHLSDDDIRGYEELHVDMMMSKPFDFEEIQSAVAVLTRGASVAAAA